MSFSRFAFHQGAFETSWISILHLHPSRSSSALLQLLPFKSSLASLITLSTGSLRSIFLAICVSGAHSSCSARGSLVLCACWYNSWIYRILHVPWQFVGPYLQDIFFKSIQKLGCFLCYYSRCTIVAYYTTELHISVYISWLYYW